MRGAYIPEREEINEWVFSLINTIGWRWAGLFFSYAWLSLLVVGHSLVVRLCCGKLREAERGAALKTVVMQGWRALVFTNVVLAPKDAREWVFWMVWFSSSGLLALLQMVGKEHFEHVVDNPRFGVLHTLRVLALHGLVLFATLHLAVFGWAEFYEWGKGPLGQALQLPLLSANDEGSRDPERGGAGFALLLLYDLGLTAVDVSLSGLKYLVYLVEVYRGPSSAHAEEDASENLAFFVQLGQAVLSGVRTVYIFQACGHCTLGRKICTRSLTVVNGFHALELIHRAAWKIVLARELDIAFPNATDKELKNMTADETCAICRNTMNSAKRLQCDHFFHASCLRQYLNNSTGGDVLCPICRATISWHPSVGHTLKRNAASSRPPGAHAPPARHNARGDSNNPLAGLPRRNVPTPDSLSRAARGADTAVRLGRRFAESLLGDAAQGRATAAAATAAAVAQPSGGAQEVSGHGGARTARDTAVNTPTWSGAIHRHPSAMGSATVGIQAAAGGGAFNPNIESVTMRLQEIFPFMSREEARAAVIRSGGSLQFAVNRVLVQPAAAGGQGGGWENPPGSIAPAEARADAGGRGAADSTPSTLRWRRR